MYSVDWESGIITVPQADLVYLAPNEYKLDIYEFMLECWRLSWGEGLSYPEIITYKTAFDTGDVIIARGIKLNFERYSVVFEDTPERYSINLDGANTNVHRYCAITNGVPYPNNSTGLQDLSTLLAMAYMDRVVLDTVKGQGGTATPIGTLGTPSGNVVDSVSIAHKNGLSRILAVRSITLCAGDDVSELLIMGIDPSMTTVTIETEAVCQYTRFMDIHIIGVFDGDSSIEHCSVGNIDFFSGTIDSSSINGTITLNGTNDARLHSCTIGDFDIIPTIDINNGEKNLIMTQYTGSVNIINATNPANMIGIGLNAGQVIIDASCTEGTFMISGDGTYINNGGANVVVDDSGLNNPASISKSVWEYVI